MNAQQRPVMPIIKWRTNHGPKPEKIECTRETEHFIWFSHEHCRPAQRYMKMTESAQFHDSWDAAQAHLLNHAQESVDSLQGALKIALQNLDRLKSNENPDGHD